MKGRLTYESEQGSDPHWLFTPESSIHGPGPCPWSSEPCPANDVSWDNPEHWSYEGRIFPSTGDRVTFFDSGETILWDEKFSWRKFPDKVLGRGIEVEFKRWVQDELF